MEDAEIAQVLGTDEASVYEVRVGLLRNLAEQVAPEQAESELPELEAAVTAQLYPEAVTGAVTETEVEAEALEEAPEAEAAEAAEVDVAEEPTAADEAPSEPTRRRSRRVGGGPREPAEPAEPVDEPEAEAEHAEELEAEPEPLFTREPGFEPTRGRTYERKRRWSLLLLPLLLVVGLVALVIALASGGDDESNEPASPQAGAAQPSQPAGDEAPRRAIRMNALGRGGASGTAVVRDGKLTLRLHDLPSPQGGVYTVWLYDSIIDAKRLTDVRGDTARATLPANAKNYEFIDVSLEPKDGNPNHSGRSVVRIPVDQLEGR